MKPFPGHMLSGTPVVNAHFQHDVFVGAIQSSLVGDFIDYLFMNEFTGKFRNFLSSKDAKCSFDISIHKETFYKKQYHDYLIEFLNKQDDLRFEEVKSSPLFDGIFEPILAFYIYLAQLTGFNPDMIEFILKMFAGILIKGNPDKKVIIIIGVGNNGKTNFINAMHRIFNFYCVVCDKAYITGKKEHSNITKESMDRACLMIGDEITEVPEEIIKIFAGQTATSVRGIYERSTTKISTVTLVFTSNDLPTIVLDRAGLNRILAFEFTSSFIADPTPSIATQVKYNEYVSYKKPDETVDRGGLLVLLQIARRRFNRKVGYVINDINRLPQCVQTFTNSARLQMDVYEIFKKFEYFRNGTKEDKVTISQLRSLVERFCRKRKAFSTHRSYILWRFCDQFYNRLQADDDHLNWIIRLHRKDFAAHILNDYANLQKKISQEETNSDEIPDVEDEYEIDVTGNQVSTDSEPPRKKSKYTRYDYDANIHFIKCCFGQNQLQINLN